ncbi:MAG TPA: universal stress protein [Verrucomicrobiae bacterium]|jgi:nucleotide-binding universal stress UspA family protein|nr:universal stress protein [Verrucomicrobiae bacterium]
MKILVGIDGSPHSKAALDYVKSMAWPKGTNVAVVSAAVPMVAYTMVDAAGLSWMQTAEEDMSAQAKELTARAAQELTGAGLPTEARVVRGDPRDALVDTARTMGADLVVVGSHGRTGLAKLVLGSVASHVVTHAPCSVLVVKMK